MSGLVRPDVPPTTISTSVHRFFLVWASEKEHILNYLINTEDNTLGDMSARQPPKCHKSTNPSRPFFQTRNGDPSTTVSLVIYAAIRKKKKKKVKAKYEGEKDIWMSGRICGQRGQTLQRAGGELSVSCDPVFKTGQAISHFKML